MSHRSQAFGWSKPKSVHIDKKCNFWFSASKNGIIPKQPDSKKKYITFASNNKDNFEIPFQLFFDFLMRKLKNTVGYKLIARAIAQFIWNSSSLELLSDTYFSFEFVIDYLKTMVIPMFQHFILE